MYMYRVYICVQDLSGGQEAQERDEAALCAQPRLPGRQPLHLLAGRHRHQHTSQRQHARQQQVVSSPGSRTAIRWLALFSTCQFPMIEGLYLPIDTALNQTNGIVQIEIWALRLSLFRVFSIFIFMVHEYHNHRPICRAASECNFSSLPLSIATVAVLCLWRL